MKKQNKLVASKILGSLLLLAPFAGIIIQTGITDGWEAAITILLKILFTVLFIIIGAYLLFSGMIKNNKED